MMMPHHYNDVRDNYGIEKIHPHAMRLSNKTTRDSSVHDPTDDHSGVLRGDVDVYSPLNNFDHSFDHSAPVPIRGETAPPTRTSASANAMTRHMHSPAISSHDDHFYPIRGEHPFPSAMGQHETPGAASGVSLHNASPYVSPRPQGGSSSNKISYSQRHQHRQQQQAGPHADAPLHMDDGVGALSAPALPTPKRSVEYIPPAPIPSEDKPMPHHGSQGIQHESEIRRIPTPMRRSDTYVAPSAIMTGSAFEQGAENTAVVEASPRDGAAHLQLRPPLPIPQRGTAQPESSSRPLEVRNLRQGDLATLADTSLTPEHRKTKVLDGTRTNFSSAFGFSEPDDAVSHFAMPQHPTQHQQPISSHISPMTSPALPMHESGVSDRLRFTECGPAERLEARNVREERPRVSDHVLSVDFDTGSHHRNSVRHRITVPAPSAACSAPLLAPPLLSVSPSPINYGPPPAPASYPPLPTTYTSTYSSYAPGPVQVTTYDSSTYSGALPYPYDPHAGTGSAMAPQPYAGTTYPSANGLSYHPMDQTEYQPGEQTEYHTVGYTDYATPNVAQCVPQASYGQPQVNFPKAGQTTQMTSISTDNRFLEPTRGMDPELNNCQYQDVNVSYGPPVRSQQPPQTQLQPQLQPQPPPQPPPQPQGVEPQVLLEGWLKKRGPKYGMDWKLRHCVLTADGRLSYWRDKGEEKKGDIEIQPDSVIRFFKDPGATSEARVMAHKYPNGLEIFQGNDVRTWYLDAGTREKQVIWHRAITDCIMRARQRYR
eukprot:GEMP01001055.1.p1 GENE.GEMP01001055.1~~GEMP01001055.1.p1  ORF type:complete len:767 (+),score=142.46 GEMP01001055.1:330-2630(+)